MTCYFDRKQRIEFDNDTLDDEIDYLIFLNIDQIDHVLFDIDHPTAGLLNVFYIWKSHLCDKIFSINQIETVFASVAAAEI